MIIFSVVLSIIVLASCKDDTPATTQDDTTPVTHDELRLCGDDEDATRICLACTDLPFELGLPPGDCCTDTDAYEMCKNCLQDPLKCLTDVITLIQGNTEIDDGDYDDSRSEELETSDSFYPIYTDKRYGTLFFGQRPIYIPTRSVIPEIEKRPLGKRWGSLNLGKRWGTLGMAKRWGTLGMAKKWGTLNMGKRYGTLGLGTLGKRYGTLSLGKRFGTLNLGKKWGSLNLGKRFGTLNLGKRYGTLNLGKRYGSLSLGKKWGSLNLGKRFGNQHSDSTYGYYPFKREDFIDAEDDAADINKRYGRLFLSTVGVKRS